MTTKLSDPLAFWKKYELVRSTKTFTASQAKPKFCRFCKRSELQTAFNIDAHLISELLGSNTVISTDECDACNKIFSGYESHLSKFFLPYLTMTGTEGKRGVPVFHSRTIDRDENTRTIVKSHENKRQVILSDLPDYEIDKENKRMTLTFRKPPLIPFFVYKALAKIGVALLPEQELGGFDEVFTWLISDSEQVSVFVTCLINVLTYKKFAEPWADFYKAKRVLYSQSFVPEYTLIVGFANIILQIFLPISDSLHGRIGQKKPVIEVFPGFAFDDLSRKKLASLSVIDLAEKHTVVANHRLHFTYQEATFRGTP